MIASECIAAGADSAGPEHALAQFQRFTYPVAIVFALGGVMTPTVKTGLTAGVKALRESLVRKNIIHADLERTLTEALEQRTATAEILRTPRSAEDGNAFSGLVPYRAALSVRLLGSKSLVGGSELR